MSPKPVESTVAVHDARLDAIDARLGRIEGKQDSLLYWLLGGFSGTLLTLLYVVFSFMMRAGAK